MFCAALCDSLSPSVPFGPECFVDTPQVKMAPKAVSQREESELQAMLERLALENEEIDGDAPEDV